ncbi:MAG: NAD(P)/FAD-dependent oxidoreductase [Prochloraceae cyanobacterium]|nr:NAD(P)/FAD-dependent oxidoreductase [Prochloraceae cyanobacterium]
MFNAQQKLNKAITKSIDNLDAVVIGAGFAGLFMLHRLRELGLFVRVFEAAQDLGGTWFSNRYPGARCDVESMEYSYQFSEELQQEWKWTERYASQPEILNYINYVADKFDLRQDIQFNSRVKRAVFNEAIKRWTIEIEDGQKVNAQFCIMATGCLSATNLPKFKGLEIFQGSLYHTGNWPSEKINFSGKTVGIIGTGSSAVQSIPIIAQEAKHLFVFQRTPNYVVPARNQPIDPLKERQIKADYANFRERNNRKPAAVSIEYNDRSALDATREERQLEYERRWQEGGFNFLGAFNDLITNQAANETAAEFVRSKIRQIVDDPKVAEILSPHHVLGCKRLCLDTNYYQTYNRSNVTLVDLSRLPIEEIIANGLRIKGKEYPLDCLILATGFDAMTGALLKINIRGKNGITLKDKWSAGPKSYLGICINGFPNLFTISGPGSPSVLTNMLPSIEQHVNWIAECIKYLRESDFVCIEATKEAEEAWVVHVNQVASQTLLTTCNSWYLGANIPGKPRVFMPYIGFPAYVAQCDRIVLNAYQGFRLT